ncbi:hypothetical protein ACO0LL_29670 [Undibacterium sp. TC4M20W]|uniref:hypothetical protein n=1 Tax=Undibacterium sp. TC4M20W TaxID=3413052 RepID=UPI003BEFA6B0
MDDFTCTNCGGPATLISSEGVINTYICNNCGSKIESIVYYVREPSHLGVDYYRAVVIVANKILARKTAIKIRRIFSGLSNFGEAALQKQIDEGSGSLDLGIYSGREIEELTEKAKTFDLNLTFVYDSSV